MLGLAAMIGADLIVPLRAAIAAELDPVNLTGGDVFDDATRSDIAALAETIIPTTDTPGARDAGVADFIEFMLQEWYPTEEFERFQIAIETLISYCNKEYSSRFADLDENQHFVILSDMETGRVRWFEDGGKDFFNHLKQLTLFGYYTSEIGMTVERKYLPVPGGYDGAYPYEKVGTLFTS